MPVIVKGNSTYTWTPTGWTGERTGASNANSGKKDYKSNDSDKKNCTDCSEERTSAKFYYGINENQILSRYNDFRAQNSMRTEIQNVIGVVNNIILGKVLENQQNLMTNQQKIMEKLGLDVVA